MLRAIALACVCACGRIDFGAVASGSGADAMGDGAALGFCAQHTAATFCADFDGMTLGWDTVHTFLGTSTVDTSKWTSPPKSFQVDTTTIGGAQEVDDGVEKFLSMATTVSVEFDVFIDTVGTSDPILMQLAFDDGSEIHGIEIAARVPPGLAYIEDSNTPNGMSVSFAYFQAVTLEPGSWHHVRLDYTSGASAHLTLAFDSVTVIDTAPMYTTGGMLSVQLGVVFLGGPAMPWEMHFDNFELTAQ